VEKRDLPSNVPSFLFTAELERIPVDGLFVPPDEFAERPHITRAGGGDHALLSQIPDLCAAHV
jgi:hypothetical protein